MSTLVAMQSKWGPKNNIGTPGIGSGTVGSGTPHSPDTVAKEKVGGIYKISGKSNGSSDLDTSGPSLAGTNLYSNTTKYVP
jgi:hypothetical protein